MMQKKIPAAGHSPEAPAGKRASACMAAASAVVVEEVAEWCTVVVAVVEVAVAGSTPGSPAHHKQDQLI